MFNDKKKETLLRQIKIILNARKGITQIGILSLAQEKHSLRDGRFVKSTFSRALKANNYKKIPEEVYLAITDILNEHNQENQTDIDTIAGITDHFSLSLSLFIGEKHDNKKRIKRSLLGQYWGFMPSTAAEGNIAKYLINITQSNTGAFVTEETYYYRKRGAAKIYEQKNTGYVVGKDSHYLFIQKDPHTPLLRICLMRPVNYDGKKYERLVGKITHVSSRDEGISILTRDVIFMRTEEEVPNDKNILIEQYGVIDHAPDTKDEQVRELFSVLLPNSVSVKL